MLANPNPFLIPPPFVFPDAPNPNDSDAFSDADDADTQVVALVEPPTNEPEWMLIEPWVLEAVREYDACRRVW